MQKGERKMNYSMKTTYSTLGNVSKATFLLAILTISMFATLVPVTISSVNKAVSISAVEKLAKSLAESAAQASASALNVIVEAVESAPVMDAVTELGGEVSIVYGSAEVLAASVPANELMELASNPSVVRIYNDHIRHLSFEGGITDEHVRTNIPLDPVINTPILEAEALEVQVESISAADIESINPSIYHNPNLTHAEEVWGETTYGLGTTVAIIDTGVWAASPLLSGNVIGGIDLSPDNGTANEGYDAPWNHYHGTACAHLLAAHGWIGFPVGHSWGEAILKYDPEGTEVDDGIIWTLCLGIAPLASIYGVKVFPSTGAGVPSSIVMGGMDWAIQKGVDVISMSLGGLVGADGEDPADLLVDAATEVGITVVAAAGNEGPAPLRVGSPGSAKTAITVGAAMDPIHERVFGEIAYGGYGISGDFYYPHDEKSIVYFSSRGPSADGRIKPEVVATGSWCFLGIFADGYVRLGGGTSYSCPQVAGGAALLTTYIRQEMLPYGPTEIKQAIYDGADSIPGFTEMEQGAGYMNLANSLDVINSGSFGTIPETWPHHIDGFWFSPIDTICLEDGKATVNDLTLEPLKFLYFAFWVDRDVDSIKVTLSGVQLADPEDQNPVFGDGAWIYLSSSIRGGVDDYLFGTDPYLYFWSDATVAVFKDADFQPGVVRLVLEGDLSSYEAMFIEELTIEVTEVWTASLGKKVFMYNNGVPVDAQVEVYPGTIRRYFGMVKEGEIDQYVFNIPDDTGFAYITLSWRRDWAHWATSDLDLIIVNPDGTVNWDAVTGASPETAILLAGPGDYTLLVEGYQVYFNKREFYWIEIVYFADSTPLWSSSVFHLECFKCVRSPKAGLAVVWLYDPDFDWWYIGGFTQVRKMRACGAHRFCCPL
jgi:subtilisin family serine protease